MEQLTPSAKNLVENCPHLINRFASRLDDLIDNFPRDTELVPLEIENIGELPIIVHAGYTDAECGREK